MHLKYVPLTFINTDKARKEQISNTIFFKHIIRKFDCVRPLSELITRSQYGYTASAKDSGKFKLLRITDINHGVVDWKKVPFCDCDAPDKYLLKPGDILIARTGNNISYLVPKDIPKNIIFASYLIRFSCSKELLPDYLYKFLNSYAFWSQILLKQRGALLQNVNAQRMSELLVPYCDLALQSELLREDGNTAIAADMDYALRLYDLMISLSQQGLEQSTYLTQLRQAILQEAIEGKLTAEWRKKNLPRSPKASARKNPSGLPQASHLPLAGEEKEGSEGSPPAKGEYGEAGRGFLSPRAGKDLPAEYYDAAVLLEKIKAEKAALVAAGKLKKEKPLPPIEPGEVPFALPEGWVWTRFQDVADIASNLVAPKKYPNYIQIAPDDIEKSSGKLIGVRATVREKQIISGNHLFFSGMLLYSKVRPRLRKIVKVDFDGLCSADMYPIHARIDSDYLKLCMLSEYFDGEVYRFDNRVKMPKINQDQLNSIAIPLPPLAEQHAIVERVDKLLALVDQLEQQMAERKVQAEELMQAVLREAFG